MSPQAWASFGRLPPSQRRHVIGWIRAAKKDETRERRIREAIDPLERGEPLGMK